MEANQWMCCSAAQRQQMCVDIGYKLSEKNAMRPIVSLAAAIALAASVATASSLPAAARASHSWDRATQCSEPGGPCARGSAEQYNHCADLALERGESLNKGDRHGLDYFVYQCLAGHIPQ
jgi:hypothetical protein